MKSDSAECGNGGPSEQRCVSSTTWGFGFLKFLFVRGEGGGGRGRESGGRA